MLTVHLQRDVFTLLSQSQYCWIDAEFTFNFIFYFDSAYLFFLDIHHNKKNKQKWGNV